MEALTDLGHASEIHDRILPLALYERGTLVAVGVSSDKNFAVIVENLRLEMMMFASIVLSESCTFAVDLHFTDYSSNRK
jgi:hypothetical protein